MCAADLLVKYLRGFRDHLVSGFALSLLSVLLRGRSHFRATNTLLALINARDDLLNKCRCNVFEIYYIGAKTGVPVKSKWEINYTCI